jgi:SAM-dependent methyltransferase
VNDPSPGPAQFDSFAQNYADQLRDPLRERFSGPSSQFFFERKLEVILDFYARRNLATDSLRWLDVGCGQGDLLRLGKPHFACAVGCDPSAGMLESCADLDVRHQPVDSLPFDARSFDFVTAVCIYHHLSDPLRVALTREAFRLLRPNGIFCIIEHNPLNPVTQLIVLRTPVDADARLLGSRLTRKLLSAEGARFLDMRYFLYFPKQLYTRLSGIENRLGVLPLGGQYAVFAQTPAV